MGIFSPDTLISNMQGGGARPTLYTVTIDLPPGLSIAGGQAGVNKFKFSCEATSIPGHSQGTIRIPYMGRLIPFAGDTEFRPWETVLINDDDFVARSMIEDWLNKINARNRNVRLAADSRPARYKASATIEQMDVTERVIRTYRMIDCYPTIATPIQLGWAMQNEVERFQVVWEYTSFDVAGPTAQGMERS